MPRLLLVDDDAQLLRALSITLRAFHYQVLTRASGVDALSCANDQRPDLVMLELALPDMDGTTVIRALRGWTTVPVIVLSSRADPAAKTHALDLGADDYVTKPFCMDELHARIRAALRRGSTAPEPGRPAAGRIGDWLIDLAAHTITPSAPGPGPGGRGPVAVRREVPHLTPTEWRLLEVLLAHPESLVGSRCLLTEVWGEGHEHATNYLRVYLRQLRAKLERDPARPRHLITEPGMGYRYQP
jgi:two-component system, OmpR family, KDP operon response regulator KdpE